MLRSYFFSSEFEANVLLLFVLFNLFVIDFSTRASDRSFNPIFNKRFDHLETWLKI